MNAGMNPVANRYVVSQLVQFAVDIQGVLIGPRVGVQRRSIRARLIDITSRGHQQRSNFLTPVKEELQNRNGGARKGGVSWRGAGGRWRSFRNSRGQQIAAIFRKDQ